AAFHRRDMKAAPFRCIAADFGCRRAYTLFGFIAADFHRLSVGASGLLYDEAVIWPVAYRNRLHWIGLGTLCSPADLILGAERRCAEQHRRSCHDNSTHRQFRPPYLVHFCVTLP